MFRRYNQLTIPQLIQIRTFTALASMLAFLGIFVDRFIRGTFDEYSFIFVGSYILLQVLVEILHMRERFLCHARLNPEPRRLTDEEYAARN